MRCIYRYKDMAQCIAKTEPGKKMCTAHTLLTQMAKDKSKHNQKNYDRYNERRSRKRKATAKPKPKKVKMEAEEKIYHDHTAPWRCSLEDCSKCKDKPTYDEYMKARFQKEA